MVEPGKIVSTSPLAVADSFPTIVPWCLYHLQRAHVSTSLLVILVRVVINDVEESQLIHALGGGDHAQPVPQLLLLEEFLGQIFQISPREVDVCDDLDLAIADLADGDVIAQVARAALDLDAIVQELLEGGEVEDFVGDGLRAVDCVLVRDLPGLTTSLALGGSLLRLWSGHLDN